MDTGDRPAPWPQGLDFTAMSPEVARIIADTWKYPAPYDFYDVTADVEDHEEFVTPEQWPEWFWQVRHGGDLVGFFTAEPTGDQDTWEVSLGLRPDLTGAGRGLAFVRAGLDQLAGTVAPARIVLDVAAFNERAIRVYEAAGFTRRRAFPQRTNGAVFDFVAMELSLPRASAPC